MDEWVFAVEFTALLRRKKTRILVGGEPVALFLVGEDVYALQDTCVHGQRSLSKGALWRGRVVCPGHQWAFDPATGWSEEKRRCQPTYDVRVVDDKVYVSAHKRVRSGDVTDSTVAAAPGSSEAR
ncbi:MAG TPA: Rieske 2Fe-2S domain-containing protein [Amycolatopsis sp.]|nr:Rieske 2Fe-2S domain-containing protein [Amycolatopsis sp.]